MGKKNQKDSKFDVKNVQLKGFLFNKIQLNSDWGFPHDAVKEYNFETGYEINIPTDGNHTVVLTFNTSARTTVETFKLFKANCEIEIQFIFELKNLEELVEFKDKKLIVLDDNFLTILASIAYSTSRGLVSEKLSNTPFQKLVLPIIDPKKNNDKFTQDDKIK